MKRKYADRGHWRRVTAQRFEVRHVESAVFTGYVAHYWIDALREPLWVPFREQRICVADVGHLWTQVFPEGERYVLTTMYDAVGAVTQWYVDVVAQWGVDERGVPWYDDLYLDVIALPSGEVEIIDAEDLETALAQEIITPTEYQFAWHEARRIRDQIETGMFALLAAKTFP